MYPRLSKSAPGRASAVRFPASTELDREGSDDLPLRPAVQQRSTATLAHTGGRGRTYRDQLPAETASQTALACSYGSVSVSLRRFWVDCRQDRFRRSG